MKELQQLKTFENACEVLGIDPEKVLPDFTSYPEQDQTSMIAHSKLVIIVRAANKIANGGELWTPDWSNRHERKYEAWFDLEDGASGFRFCDYGDWITLSYCGSRLCFISSEVCKYVANQFLDLYKEYFL